MAKFISSSSVVFIVIVIVISDTDSSIGILSGKHRRVDALLVSAKIISGQRCSTSSVIYYIQWLSLEELWLSDFEVRLYIFYKYNEISMKCYKDIYIYIYMGLGKMRPEGRFWKNAPWDYVSKWENGKIWHEEIF